MIIEKTPLQLRNLKPISFCFKIDLKNKKKNSFLKLNYFQTHWKKKKQSKNNTSSYDKTVSYLKRGSDILGSFIFPARVRIWVISIVIAPNKHKSCKSCSSRTRPSITAMMIVTLFKVFFKIKKLLLLFLFVIIVYPVIFVLIKTKLWQQ